MFKANVRNWPYGSKLYKTYVFNGRCVSNIYLVFAIFVGTLIKNS